MPVLDRREPGVYVTIEDASYVAPAAEIGRTVFCVGICEKGRHNRVVEVNSQGDFQDEFGKPDYHVNTQSHYNFDAALANGARGMYIRVVPDDAKVANVSIEANASPTESVGTGAEFTFTEGSTTVGVDVSVFDDFSEGDWIYCDDGVDSSLEARQIISKDDDTDEYTLDSAYDGATTGWGSKSDTAFKYTPYLTAYETRSWDWNPASSSDVDSDVVYAFHVTGAGAKYYNNFKIKGSRNIELEKMYVDSDGDVLYPYMFMDIGIYRENDDGSGDTLLEGPWSVSLAERTPDRQIIRDLASGEVMYIQEVINTRSNLVQMVAGSQVDDLSLPDSPTNNPISEQNRLIIMLLMAAGQPVGTNNYVALGNALEFANGADGTTDGSALYNTSGDLYQSDEIWGQVKLAYMGSMTSIDGSIEQLREVTYPLFEPDYVITGGWNATVQEGGRYLADYRQDCFHIGETGLNYSYSDDLDDRLNNFAYNNWTSMLYTQWRKITDPYTGVKIYMNPVYHAIQRHLSVDATYFLAEPVAGIEKGAISEPIELAYKANHTERGDLIDAELNPTIVEPQGKYFLTQLTTWKRLSILKRAHAAKFVAYVRKMVPPLVKDLLQRKGTAYWIGQAQSRVDYFLSKFASSPVERYQILSSYSVNVEFDDVASELNIYINLTPLRVIERINVYIIVQ